ncbi:MAG: GlxA family transcriptional regulator [Mycobacteriaceae bacterium]|uniref:GlxA family transcriptional regulator n=2 Tax=Corynebacterium sp. TaxID=1720 RepID=UPI003F96A47A
MVARDHRPARHRVVVLLAPPVIGFDATIPSLVFGTARDTAGHPLYDVRLCSTDAGPADCVGGFSLNPDADLTALQDADTVIVPGTHRRSVRRDGVADRTLRETFDLIRPDTRIMSVCTGAFALGAAGILDGRPATTHWECAEDFRRLYPLVDLDEKALFTDDGDVLTSAGLSAGMDLCIHVLRRDHGWEVANRVARHCVTPPHRDGDQSQFIERPLPASGDSGTSPTRDWALDHLDEPLSVAGLAAHARMSVRTFMRRFRAETGTTPAQWLSGERVRRTQELLESTDLTVDAIAARVGFGTGATLRARLRAETGTTPGAYRRRFTAVDSRP